MFNRKSFVVLTMLIALLVSACKSDTSTPTSMAAPDTPLPASPTVALTSPPATPAATPTLFPEPSTLISVPPGKPHAIDGTMSPGEWDGARVETFSDGSELFLMTNEGFLYLAIRSATPEMIVGNIFVEREGEIEILHASAALGTARYAKTADVWQQTQAFVWRCRRTDDSDTAQAERDAFFEDERWVATNSRIGTPNELEYQIEVMGESLRLAANILRSSDPNAKIPWPADLDDDSIKPTPGGLPEHLQFSPDKWVTISIPD